MRRRHADTPQAMEASLRSPSGAFLYRMPGYSSSFVTGVAVHEAPRHIPGRGRKDDAMSWLSVIDRYSVS
jgi:hypothetical protein